MATNVVPVRFNRKEALALWHDVTLNTVLSSDPALSPRQMVILTTIYLEAGPHTVRSLAHKMELTKSPVTRAIDQLEARKLLRRCADPRDKRSILIERTPYGTNYLSRFADDIRDNLKSNGQVA